MRNKFFFGAVGFFLVCLFVLFALFASDVVRAAALVRGEQVQIAVVQDAVSVPDDVPVSVAVVGKEVVGVVGVVGDGENVVGVVG
jgi:hypothetical protein